MPFQLHCETVSFDFKILFIYMTSKIYLIILLAILSGLSVVGVYIYKFGFGLWDKPEEWGWLGDFFGGVLNPIFGLLGIFILLYTLHITKEDLRETKQALLKQERENKINRTTDLFFKQCEIINLKQSQISIEGFTGSSAFKHLKNNITILEVSSNSNWQTESSFLITFLTERKVRDFFELLRDSLFYFHSLLEKDDIEYSNNEIKNLLGLIEINLNFPLMLEASISLKEASSIIYKTNQTKFINSNYERTLDLVISKMFELKQLGEPDNHSTTITGSL